MAYDPNSPLSLAEQSQRNHALTGLENFLTRVAPFAIAYEAVIAEGYSATVPALGVSTLVTLLRIRNGLPMPAIGRIKSRHGPVSIYPEVPSLSDPSNPSTHRGLLVTECIYRGDGARKALEKLRVRMPEHMHIDVAAMTDSGIGGSLVVESAQRNGERLIIGGREMRDIAAGNYFWDGGKEISTEMKRKAVALGREVAVRFYL